MLRMARPVPLFLAPPVLLASREHWNTLHPPDRRLAGGLRRKSKGDPRRLTPDERRQLRELVRHLEVGRFARTVAPIAWRGRRRRA